MPRAVTYFDYDFSGLRGQQGFAGLTRRLLPGIRDHVIRPADTVIKGAVCFVAVRGQNIASDVVFPISGNFLFPERENRNPGRPARIGSLAIP